MTYQNSAGAGGYVGHSDSGNNYRVVVLQKKCIEPLWESKSDYQIFSLLAERLGLKRSSLKAKPKKTGLKPCLKLAICPSIYPGRSLRKRAITSSTYRITISQRRPCAGSMKAGRAILRIQATPKKAPTKPHELGTYSGKIEFVSQSLLKHLPDDEESPPMPQYIPSWEGHESELAKKYPLQLITPHPRYSFHTHHDKNDPWLDEIPGHRVMKDGYAYLVVHIHTSDAENEALSTAISSNFTMTGAAVLGAAHVTERMKPGVVHSWCSSGKYDPMEPGKPGSVDRGGCMNLLTPERLNVKECSRYGTELLPDRSTEVGGLENG